MLPLTKEESKPYQEAKVCLKFNLPTEIHVVFHND